MRFRPKPSPCLKQPLWASFLAIAALWALSSSGPAEFACSPFHPSLHCVCARFSEIPVGAAEAPPAPFPDAAVILNEVEAHQKQMELARENYTFRSSQTIRQFDKNGKLKGVSTEEYEIFFVNRREIRKLVRKDGKDLPPDQAKREQDRVEKLAKKYSDAGEQDPYKDEITVARLLELVKFSHPRRISLRGRDTILFDFAGDPHVRTHGRDEEALKKVSGVVWIDERDRQVAHMSATLEENYHVGFGFLASVSKGSNLVFDQDLVRSEIWLPTQIQLHLNARALLLVGVHSDVEIRFDDYRKFQTNAVEQPRSGTDTQQKGK